MSACESYFLVIFYIIFASNAKPLFHSVLAFVRQHFVLVEKYQVKFYGRDQSFKIHSFKHYNKALFCINVMCFTKIELCSQECLMI